MSYSGLGLVPAHDLRRDQPSTETESREMWATTSFHRLAGGRVKILKRDILGDPTFIAKITILGLCVKASEAVSAFLQKDRPISSTAKFLDLCSDRRSPFIMLSQFLTALLCGQSTFRYTELLQKTVEAALGRSSREQSRELNHLVRVVFSVVAVAISLVSIDSAAASCALVLF